ncbi:MAG: tRNA 4-thiouridine(8) synthase ThiI [bacterium]
MCKKNVVGLFSGGLDSWLSALLIKQQGFNVYLLHFVSPYFGYSEEKLEEIEQRLKERGLNLIVHKFGQDYIDNIVKNPKHGTGSAVNACVDCHSYMLQIAKKKMEELNAVFVFSGEVLAQRPMSQRKEALNMVEKESGLRGYLVRPLSAKLLKPTIPEQEGVLNREMLMDISGRGRKRQFELAEKFNLTTYPQPAGGCKFTDPNLTKRFNVMMETNKDLTWVELELLKWGRHFYLGDNFYFMTARDEKEVTRLYDYAKLGTIVEPKDAAGSTGLLLNYNYDKVSLVPEKQALAGRIIARYTKTLGNGRSDIDMVYLDNGVKTNEAAVSAISELELNNYRL